VDRGRIAKGAELSTASVGACDEPTDAVGNSGRIRDFILRGDLVGMQGKLLGQIGQRFVFAQRSFPVRLALAAFAVSQSTTAATGETAMNVTEIVELIKQETPQMLGQMPDKRAAMVIRLGLLQLGKYLNNMEEGVVRVPGLGKFHVKQLEVEKDGKKIKTKRTFFTAEEPKIAATQRAAKA